MKYNYNNPLMGQPKAEIERAMRETNDKLADVNLLMCNPELLGSLNQTFDMCVEALYAEDCGDCWQITRASGDHKTFNVRKSDGSIRRCPHPINRSFYLEEENSANS